MHSFMCTSSMPKRTRDEQILGTVPNKNIFLGAETKNVAEESLQKMKGAQKRGSQI
jgi:hypothetical protein